VKIEVEDHDLIFSVDLQNVFGTTTQGIPFYVYLYLGNISKEKYYSRYGTSLLSNMTYSIWKRGMRKGNLTEFIASIKRKLEYTIQHIGSSCEAKQYSYYPEGTLTHSIDMMMMDLN